MTNIQSSTSVRQVALGQYVDRPTATLPQGAAGNIFTVTGRVILTSFVGLITSALGATATTLKVSHTPTVGTVGDLCTAGTVTSLAAGQTLTLPAAPGSALVLGPTTGTGLVNTAAGLLLPAGTLSITTSAGDTGSVRWTATYIPYDAGASIAAA